MLGQRWRTGDTKDVHLRFISPAHKGLIHASSRDAYRRSVRTSARASLVVLDAAPGTRVPIALIVGASKLRVEEGEGSYAGV